MGDFQPKVKWQYDGPDLLGVRQTPVVAPLIDTNGDGLINERDVPAVIMLTANPSGSHLTALRGDTGAVIFSVPELPGVVFDTLTMPAVGDLVGDGKPEIIVANYFGSGPRYCFNNDGTLKWTSPPVTYKSPPVIADLGPISISFLLTVLVFAFLTHGSRTLPASLDAALQPTARDTYGSDLGMSLLTDEGRRGWRLRNRLERRARPLGRGHGEQPRSRAPVR